MPDVHVPVEQRRATDALSHAVSVERSDFGRLPDLQEVSRWTLSNGAFRVEISDYGARLMGVWAPDRRGDLENVVLGCERLEDYLAAPGAYLGATCGRYANRLRGSRLHLEGTEYALGVNEATGNTLHGGRVGFDQRVWAAKAAADGVVFELVSPDGDQGFPGELAVRVVYRLQKNALVLEYECHSNRVTVANLTNHAYFNLGGVRSGTVRDHLVQISAERYLPVDTEFLPTGEFVPVGASAFDLREFTSLAQRLVWDEEQLRMSRGFNHTFVLNPLRQVDETVATAVHPESGRTLSVKTTEPGLHLYTGGFLDVRCDGEFPLHFGPESGLCLETQHFPDSPNHPEFPTTLLEPGRIYRSKTIYEFGCDERA